MFRKIFALAVAPVAVALVGLGAAGAANASVTPNTVLDGVNVTTNNGVAGYYTDNPSGFDSNLQWNQVITPTDESMTAGTDGVGGQLSNPQTGQTFGAGVERIGTTNTFGIFFAYGYLNGDPGAIFNDTSTDADSNKALGGILPSATPLQLTAPAVHVGDTVHFWLHYFHSGTGAHRWWLVVNVTDRSDTARGAIRLGKGVRPSFTQAGIGNQRSLTHLTSPVNPLNVLDEVWGISTTPTFGSGFNSFGCDPTTTEVNSSATTNGDNGNEPNVDAQIDPGPRSLSGGCGYVYPVSGAYASLKIYEGNQGS